METLNMRSAALSELMIQISNQLEDHDYTPVIIIGKSGIGKQNRSGNLPKQSKSATGNCAYPITRNLIWLVYLISAKTVLQDMHRRTCCRIRKIKAREYYCWMR